GSEKRTDARVRGKEIATPVMYAMPVYANGCYANQLVNGSYCAFGANDYCFWVNQNDNQSSYWATEADETSKEWHT
ncbi:unnamed protein product, partial [Oppiella nova]